MTANALSCHWSSVNGRQHDEGGGSDQGDDANAGSLIRRSAHVDLVSDRSTNIRDSVADVELTLTITICLIVLTMFVFLRKVWATVIPA